MRRSLQKLRESVSGVVGEQGRPGLGSVENVNRWMIQQDIKANEDNRMVVLFSVPPAWTLVMLTCGAYCTSCNQVDPGTSARWRVRADPDDLDPWPLLSWHRLAGTQCALPTTEQMAWYWWAHPTQSGSITVQSTSAMGYSYFPNVPFLINPDRDAPVDIVLEAKYSAAGATFPAAQFIAWGTYIVAPDTIETPIVQWAESFEPGGGCPSFPKA